MADNIKLVTKEYVDTELSTKANKVISNMSYESFIDTYHLREPEWVDLSFVGGEYYYTDFNTAVTDVNNGNTAGASSDKTGAVCQIFTDGNITVLRLLSDITVTTNIVFTKSIIFDINGFTVTVRDSGRIGSQTVAYDISVIFYGAKTDSNILSTNMLVMFANTSNFFLIGGKYSTNSSLAGAYVIYVPPYNIPINIEIYNAELQVVYNNPQSTNNISCVIVTNKTSITNLLINNTKCVTNGTNRYTYAYITTTAANPETKVTILNSDIEAYGADQSDNSPCGILISAGYAKIISSNIKGITSGIQVGRQGNVYIKDSKCYAPYHGGIYNAHILYAENTEFHRSATPEGYTPTGTGCAYFGYGSTTYLNNCKFIRDVESDTSPGIVVRKEGTPEGETTRVFVSNSEMPGIRCDADQEIYLGNGISDTIKNATVQGKKYLTDNNYVYIEESNAAYSLLNPDFNAANKNYVDNHVGNITTTEAEEHAQVDSTEILTVQTGTWVTDGWTGDAATGFTHTSGNTSILKYPITGSDYTAEGTLYDITFNCSVAPTVDNIMVRIGNSDLFNLYGQEEPLNIGVKSKGSTDGTIYLEFIPSSTFTGTISNIEVHKITGTYVGKYKITDSNGSTSFEVRADTVNKYNAFIGVDSGSYNTTGNGNAGFGYKALASNTSGFWNTGIGFEALQFVNAGSRNIGIGALAGRHIETGQRNIAIGSHSLRENRTGNFNIAIGADSQLSSTSGEYNIGVGTGTLYYNNGSENIAIGRQAIASTGTSGQNNIAIGAFSLNSVQGDNNIAIGRNAGYSITTGIFNIVIGAGSGRNGNKNTIIGTNSGGQLTENSLENTVIGFYSGTNLTNNKHCILIGNRIAGETNGDYQLNIGNLIKGSTQSSNKYVNIDGSLSAKNMSVDNVGTTDTAVVNKKYVDDTYATKTDLRGKLDKVTSVGTYRRAYAIMPNGTGYIQEIDYNATASTLVLRDGNGALRATTPTASSGGDIVATKKYVDDAIGNIKSILATMFNDVSTQSDEEPTDDEEVIA